MYEDDWVGLRLLGRNALLDIHLPDHVALAAEVGELTADVEETVLDQ